MAPALHSIRTPANRRTGRTKGYAGQKGGAHQVAWCDDPVILDRIHVGLKPWLERRSPLECLEVIRAHMARAHPGEPETSLRTMFEDRQRAQILTTGDLNSLKAEHLAEFDHVLERAWEMFEVTNQGASGRAAILGTISQTIERKAKVDGTLSSKALGIGIAIGESSNASTVVDVDMSDEAMARILATAMDLRESHGLVIDAGTEFISPFPTSPSNPPFQLAPPDDDGVDDYVERS